MVGMTKLALSTVLFVAGIVSGYLYVIFGITGFLIAKLGGGRGDGERGLVPSIILPLGGFRLHLHHWIICGVAMAVLVGEGIHLAVSPEILYGLLGGVGWQGVYCYNDWHRVVYRPSQWSLRQNA